MEPITVMAVVALVMILLGLAMSVTYGIPSGAVPTDAIALANNHRMGPFDVNGVLEPGELAEFHNATTMKRATAASLLALGVTDLNRDAQKRDLDMRDTAFSTTEKDQCNLIYEGIVVLHSDAGGGATTRGTLQRTGTAAGHHAEDVGAGLHTTVKARALTSAAVDVDFVAILRAT